MLAAADLAAFFDADMPGYALASIGGEDVAGLFRGPFEVAFNAVAVNQPSFLCATADVSAVVEGDAVTISGTAYTVATVQPDLTTGVSRLILEET